MRTQGLIDVQVDPTERHKGLATYLIGDALRQLQEQAVALIEVQTMAGNSAAVKTYRKLGFEQADGGTIFRKDAG